MPELTEAQLYDMANARYGNVSSTELASFIKQYLKDKARTDKKIKRLQAKIKKLERNAFGPL